MGSVLLTTTNRLGKTMTRQRRPKKDASITMHMPQAIKDQLTGLAEAQRAGQGASEYLFETLIIPHLDQLRAETKIKQKIFGLTGNDKNYEHRSDLSDRNDFSGK